jgi:hypothetical protein
LATDKKVKRSIANIQAYKSVFKSEDGQKVLWDLMKLNSFMQDSYVQGDPYSTAYNEGRRSVVLYILQKINENTQRLQKRYEEGMRNEEGLFDSINE